MSKKKWIIASGVLVAVVAATGVGRNAGMGRQCAHCPLRTGGYAAVTGPL